MTTVFSTGLLGFFTLSPMEIALILVFALLMFGKRLPEVARSMGRSIQEFKKGLNEAQQELHSDLSATSEPARPAIEQRPPSEPVRPPSEPAPTVQATPPAGDAAQQHTTKNA